MISNDLFVCFSLSCVTFCTRIGYDQSSLGNLSIIILGVWICKCCLPVHSPNSTLYHSFSTLALGINSSFGICLANGGCEFSFLSILNCIILPGFLPFLFSPILNCIILHILTYQRANIHVQLNFVVWKYWIEEMLMVVDMLVFGYIGCKYCNILVLLLLWSNAIITSSSTLLSIWILVLLLQNKIDWLTLPTVLELVVQIYNLDFQRKCLCCIQNLSKNFVFIHQIALTLRGLTFVWANTGCRSLDSSTWVMIVNHSNSKGGWEYSKLLKRQSLYQSDYHLSNF